MLPMLESSRRNAIMGASTPKRRASAHLPKYEILAWEALQVRQGRCYQDLR